MSLPERRLLHALDKARTKLLRVGEAPLASAIARFLRQETAPDQPIAKVVKQRRKESFDIDAHNTLLSQSEEDFQLLFEEFYDQAMRSLRILDGGDSLLRRSLYEAKVVNDLLEYELITVKGAGGYFLGNFDTFTDVSKIDLSTTTALVDLGTENVRLSRNRGDWFRHRMDHLRAVTEAPVGVENADTHLISTRTLGSHPFSHVFDSLNSSWQQEFVSTKPDGIRFSLVFWLHPEKLPIALTSVVVDPLSAGSIRLQALHSPDGTNFQALGANDILDGAKSRIAGPTEKTKRISLIFDIPRPSREESVDGLPRYTYYFGLREIELYQESYSRESVLQTIVMRPIADPAVTSVDKVALEVDEDLPTGTDIIYEVAPDTDPTNFRILSPINHPRAGQPRIVDFDQLIEIPARSNVQDITTTTVHTFSDGATKRNGTEFREIYTFPNAPQFLSVQVMRGIGAWRITKREGSRVVHQERNNLLVFSGNDQQNLYSIVEGEEIKEHPASNTQTDTTIPTRYELLTQANCPTPAATSSVDPANPCYSVLRILMKPASGVRTLIDGSTVETSFTETSATVRIGIASEGLEGEKILDFSVPVTAGLHRVSGQAVYLEYTDRGGRIIRGSFGIKRTIDRTNGGLLLLDDPQDIIQERGGSLSGKFESLNIAEDVVSVSQTYITISANLPVLRADVFVVDYKRALSSSERVVSGSVVLSRSTDGGDFIEGRDFTADLTTGRITRLPDGSISLGTEGKSAVVRASFSFETRDSRFYSYETVLTSSRNTPTTVHIAAGGVSLTEGESITLLSASGNIDLVSVPSFELVPGTHKVVVVSRPGRRNVDGFDQDTAIYRTINLKDKDDKYIFADGLYFSSQEAFEQPMSEVSFFRLQSSVRRDDKNFYSVKDSKLIFNFDPLGVDTDVITLVPGSSVPLPRERLAIGYRYLPDTSSPVTGVVLRATLRRLTAEDDRTPVLNRYNLRFLHGLG